MPTFSWPAVKLGFLSQTKPKAPQTRRPSWRNTIVDIATKLAIVAGEQLCPSFGGAGRLSFKNMKFPMIVEIQLEAAEPQVLCHFLPFAQNT